MGIQIAKPFRHPSIPGSIGGGSGKVIKSIQDVSISVTLANNQPSGADIDTTINPIEKDNCIIWGHKLPTSAEGTNADMYVRLTSSTNLRLHHASTAAAAAQTVKLYVIEYYYWVIKSLQEITNSSDPQTINSVDTAKSIFVPQSWRARNGADAVTFGPIGASILSATSVDWENSMVYSTAYGSVVEFR